jgi:hypothetical protein
LKLAAALSVAGAHRARWLVGLLVLVATIRFLGPF